MIGTKKSSEPFYGDALERFRLMSEGNCSEIDGAHFRMWCRIAAEEIGKLRAVIRVNAIRSNPSIEHSEIDQLFEKLNGR